MKIHSEGGFILMDRENQNKIIELEKELDGIFSIIKNNFSRLTVGFEIHVLRMIFFKRITDTFKNDEKPNMWRNIRNRVAHGDIDYLSHKARHYIDENINDIFNNTIYSNILTESLMESFDYLWNKSEFGYTFSQLIMYLDRIDLSEENVSIPSMGKLFKRLIDKHVTSKYGIASAPNYVNQIMSIIIDVQPGENLYDPLIGTGNLAISVLQENLEHDKASNNTVLLFGEEVNKELYTLCIMNMILNGISEERIHLRESRVIYNPLSEDEDYNKFDKVITLVPFASDPRYSFMANTKAPQRMISHSNVMTNIISHVVESLKDGGKATLLVNTDNLYNDKKLSFFRKELIEKDLIEAILFLPQGSLSNSGVDSSILVLNNKKQANKKNKIFLMNLRDNDVIDIINGNIVAGISVDELVNCYYTQDNSKDFSTIVDNSQIDKNDYNLMPSRYDPIFTKIKEMMKSGSAKKISDFADIVQGTGTPKHYDDKNGVAAITAKNLNSNIEEIRLNYDDLRYVTPHPKDKIIKSKAIIVSLYGGNLKPTIFYPGDKGIQEIIIHHTLIAIIPNEEIIDMEYLYYQLYSSNVVKQYNKMKGVNYGGISRASLSQIAVLIPSLDIQRQQVVGQKNDLLELEKLRYHNRLKSITNQDTIYDAEGSIISDLVHNVLPDVTATKLALNRVQRYLKRKNLLNDFVEERSTQDEFFDFDEGETQNEETIESVLNTINRYMKTFEQTLVKTKETVQLKLEETDFELVNLKELLLEVKELKSNEIANKYEIVIDSPDVLLSLNQETFCSAIKNLLRNAEMHGFDFSSKKKYKVEFKVSDREDCVIITYSNNGKPFTLSKDDYIKAGKKSKGSTGYGLGGAYIDRVIKAHGGSFEIIPWKEGTKMRFILPKRRGGLID